MLSNKQNPDQHAEIKKRRKEKIGAAIQRDHCEPETTQKQKKKKKEEKSWVNI